MYHHIAKELLAFLDASPTCFHAVKNMKEMLLSQGFTPLSEREKWDLSPGGRYFVTRTIQPLSLSPFPKTESEVFCIMASHSDSPTFKIKENPEVWRRRPLYTAQRRALWRHDLRPLAGPASLCGRPGCRKRGRAIYHQAGQHRPGPGADSQHGNPHQQGAEQRLQVQPAEGFTACLRRYFSQRHLYENGCRSRGRVGGEYPGSRFVSV